jgi:hypothetical protein
MLLYKYCDAEGIKILEEKRIKIPTPADFNDPFDCLPWVDVDTPSSREALRQKIFRRSSPLARNPPKDFDIAFDETLKSGLQDELLIQSRNNIGVLCLSEKVDNHLMWSHYSKNHTGFLIELETNGLYEIGKPDDLINSTRIFKVIYTNNRPRISFDDSVAHFLTQKDAEWCYEQEWRIFYRKEELKPGFIKEKPALFLDFPLQQLRNIYLGSKFDPEKVSSIIRILQSPEFSSVGLFRKHLDGRTYNLINDQIK